MPPSDMNNSKNVHALPPMARLYDLMNERGTWHRSSSQRIGSSFPSFHSNDHWSNRSPVLRSASYSRIQTVPKNPMIQSSPRRVSSFSSISTSGSISRHIGDHPEDVIESCDPVRCLSNKSSSSTVADSVYSQAEAA